jgi:hypothetical protein
LFVSFCFSAVLRFEFKFTYLYSATWATTPALSALVVSQVGSHFRFPPSYLWSPYQWNHSVHHYAWLVDWDGGLAKFLPGLAWKQDLLNLLPIS